MSQPSAFPQSVRLVLYDLTSVYFEVQGPDHLAQYGHSLDHRGDWPQVLLALATDTDGLPLHVSVLRGNRNDTQTLQGLLHMLRRRFGITQASFVFDGGMSSQVNGQKLASQVGRSLQRLKAHKYFRYSVNTRGQLQWERKEAVIAQEAQQGGLHTNQTVQECPGEQILGHYKGLLDVEKAFCELKTYLEVRLTKVRLRPQRASNRDHTQ